MKLTVFTDGSSRGNPGPSGIGIVIKNGKKLLKEIHRYIGWTTNNKAEYLALISALIDLQKIEGVESINIYTDSRLMHDQVNGHIKVEDKALKELYIQVKKHMSQLPNAELGWINNKRNKAADKLAKYASLTLETSINEYN